MVKTREELIRAYVDFFVGKEHKEIPSASLIPENDPTVLFTTAGMHPLVPYLSGKQRHPLGSRLVNVQKCIRTGDIEEVGDEVHHTFFEMLGNWSLGYATASGAVDTSKSGASSTLRQQDELRGYWKNDAIKWSYEFLTDVLGFDKNKLAVSCFAGDENAERDEESAEVWKSLGVAEKRIAFLGKEDNWWGPAGESGPCGPDTEMFYWTGEGEAPEEFNPEDKNWVEVGNDVLMQYNRDKRLILVDGMHCLYDKDFNPNKELLDFLNSLNTHTVLTVNGFRERGKDLVKDYGAGKNTNWDAFSLEEDGIKKDNPEYFRTLLKKFNLSRKEVIYFDHSEESVNVAKSIGIMSQHYQGIDSVREFVKDNLYWYEPLEQKNVDFGGGVERTLAVLEGVDDNYETTIFKPILAKIEEISGKQYSDDKKSFRVIADHLRAAVFILGDPKGIKPGNVGQGYVLRRLIRRAVRYARMIGITENFTQQIGEVVIPHYKDYDELEANREFILFQLDDEEKKFRETLEKGLRKFENILSGMEGRISGKNAFLLFQSYGFPIEMTVELAKEKGREVDTQGFEEEEKRHQDLSRTASAGTFKSGLADDSEATTRLHTATHLLNEALRKVLGNNVRQRGSNINPERLRFDFSFDRKLTDEERQQVADLVNEKIRAGLEVVREEMSLEEAMSSGAQGEFGAKYPDIVSVYTVLDPSDERGWFSREICTGPHVANTKEIGHFRIVKEQSVATGVRRIKATVE